MYNVGVNEGREYKKSFKDFQFFGLLEALKTILTGVVLLLSLYTGW